jgi:hypothetical protein
LPQDKQKAKHGDVKVNVWKILKCFGGATLLTTMVPGLLWPAGLTRAQKRQPTHYNRQILLGIPIDLKNIPACVPFDCEVTIVATGQKGSS